LESQNEKDYMEIDLVEVFYILKKNLRNIFVVTLCCVLIAAAYVFLQPKAAVTYTSEALVRVRQWPNMMQMMGFTMPEESAASETNENNVVTNLGYTTPYLNQRLLTYAELLKSNAILSPVNEAIKTTGTVKATPVKDTEMMKISFSANTAEKAQKGNELLIQRLQEYLSSNENSEVRYMEKGTSGEQPPKLIFAENVRIDVIDAPTLPVKSAETKKNWRFVAVSAFLGILFGCGYAILKAMMNRKLTTEQDVEDYLGLPVLGTIPEEMSLATAMASFGEMGVLRKIGGFLWK